MGNFDHLVRRFTEELEQLVTNPDRVAPRASAHHHAITHCSGMPKLRRWWKSTDGSPVVAQNLISGLSQIPLCLTQCEACTEAIPNPLEVVMNIAHQQQVQNYNLSKPLRSQ